MLGPLTYASLSSFPTTYADKVIGYAPLFYWRLNESNGGVVVDYGSAGINADYVSGVTLGGDVDPAGSAVSTFAASSLVDFTSNLAALSDTFPRAEGSLVAWFKPPRYEYLDNQTEIDWMKFSESAQLGFRISLLKGIGIYSPKIVDTRDSNRDDLRNNTFTRKMAYGWIPFIYTWNESTSSSAGYIHGSEWATGAIGTALSTALADAVTYLTKNIEHTLTQVQIYNYALTAEQAADLSIWDGATNRYFCCGDSRVTDNDYWVNELGGMLTENAGGYWREEPGRVGLMGQRVESVYQEINTNFPSYTEAPSHVFINVGANDQTAPATSESSFKTSYRNLIERLRGDWPSCNIWLTAPYKDPDSDGGFDDEAAAMKTWVTEIATEYSNCELGNDETVWFKNDIANLSFEGDRVHYNNDGHKEVVNQWATALGY